MYLPNARYKKNKTACMKISSYLDLLIKIVKSPMKMVKLLSK